MKSTKENNMSELSLFSGNQLVNSELFKSLQEVNDNLLSGASSVATRRISIRGSKFREIVNGDQVNVSKESTMNIVIVNAAPVSRVYYEGAYDPNTVTPPTCWSADTRTPAEEVPVESRQASRCAECPMNIKGSGQGETRACKFGQRIAIASESDLDTVFQLQLPATSIFGEAKGNLMPMQAYAKFLHAHNTPAIAIVTEMSFDEDSDVPKLYFKPVRPLEESELTKAVELKDSEASERAITMYVHQTDGVKSEAKPEAKVEESEAKVDARAEAKAEEAEPEEEPTKVAGAGKRKSKEVSDNDLSSIMDEWDD